MLMDPAGKERHFEYLFAPVFNQSKEVCAVAGIARDTTERKHQEERERQIQAKLRESARLESLGLMAGAIAHDFNNLLAGILFGADLLVDRLSNEDKDTADQIRLTAWRAAHLVRQLLAFAGEGTFDVQEFELDALIRENLSFLRAVIPPNVTVSQRLNSTAHFIEADPSQIQQVVMNFLVNASDAVGDRPGSIIVRTSVCDRPAAAVAGDPASPASLSYVVLEVTDDGVGMPPETLQRIFDPFFTTKSSGHGLGLSAVQGIVKGHGGEIEVESLAGAGSTFRMLLPESRRRHDDGKARDTEAAIFGAR